MSLRALVVGGFEPSGHDVQAEALAEAGRARGHAVDVLQWRDVANIAGHPMFESHRRAAVQGCPSIAGLLDEPWIAGLLAEDLAESLPWNYNTYLSVHPWSSVICATAVATRGASAQVLDYYGEYSAFPAVTHRRIDAYVGGGAVRSLEPAVRRRCHALGVFGAARFRGDCGAREDRLVVAAGSDGWAIGAIASKVRLLVHALSPAHLALLAPTADAADAWRASGFAAESLVEGVRDIAPLLQTSRWYLSKGGGNAVVEGLLAGCEGYVSPSGVFWEDEGAYRLAAYGVLRLVTDTAVLGTHHSPAVRAEQARAAGAAAAVWALVEGGVTASSDAQEAAMLDALVAASHPSVALPRTTAHLRERLAVWRAGWEDAP